MASTAGVCAAQKGRRRRARPAADVVGANIVELFPETRDMALAMHARARAGHRVEVPRHAQLVNGRETWWEGAIAPVPMQGGTGLLITAREVFPGQPGAAHGPRAGVAPDPRIPDVVGDRLREVAEHAPAALFVKDGAGRYVYANPWVATLLGRRLEDVIGRTVADILPRDVAERTRALESRARRAGEVVSEDAIVTAGGERVLLTVRFPITLGPGEVGTCGFAVDVTERRRAERALVESEARLRRFYDAGLIGVLHFDLDGGITEANDRFLSLVGYTREDLRAGRIAWDRMTPAEYADADARAVAELRAAGVDTPYEKEFVRKDGTRVPVLVGAATYDDSSERGIAFVLDLTDRKRAEHRAESLARFAEENPDPVLRVTADGVVSYANAPAVSRMAPLGLASGAPAPVVIAEAVAAARRAGTRLEAEVVCDDAVFLLSVVPAGNEVNVYARDITARQRVEDALRESERATRAAMQEMKTVLDTVPAAVWIARDPRGDRIDANRFGAELLRRPRGSNVSVTGPGDERPVNFRPMKAGRELSGDELPIQAAARFAREIRDFEFDLVFDDGTVRHLLGNSAPIRGDDGPRGSVGAFIDITDRKRSEEEVREASRRKDEFLAMLSHELRNPLAPIRNSVYILQRAAPGSERALRAQGVIERQTEHLTSLVDDLLDVTRIARGKIELRRSRVDLREVVSRAAEDYRLVLHDRDVAFEVLLPDGRLWADADPTRITQVVGNLLHNAAKFTHRGDRVTLSVAAVDDATAEVRVRDTGAGIDPRLVRSLFEPFVQGERTLARSEGGLGLGLALVKGIAELHGGSVRVESPGIGKGALFAVLLPLARLQRDDAPSGDDPSRAAGRCRVLVVDDNADAAESLADLVRMQGHLVDVAYDGPSALDRARVNAPDVVLCDIGLPGMSGYEVGRALRAAAPKRLQLFAVSGHARPEDVKRAIEAGFDGHVAKPADPAVIERLLAR